MPHPSRCGVLAIRESASNGKRPVTPSTPAWLGQPGGERTRTLTPVLELSVDLLEPGTKQACAKSRLSVP